MPGYIRGFDVRTGKKLWTFKTIPRPGEFGNETWENDSWKYTGNTGAWAPLSADEELGYVYIPVEAPTGDFYGGTRRGDNLFSDSLVCLDARTGKRIWHYQLVHHDIWDWDIGAPPILVDINVGGRPIKAVAQVTKQAFTFVFDRVTGKPVWPIEERPVPQSDVPGGEDFAHAAFPHQTRAIRPPGHQPGRSDRLHPGAQGRGHQDRVAIQDGTALYAADRARYRWQARDASAAAPHGRRELAGRRRRCGDRRSIRRIADQSRCAGAESSPIRNVRIWATWAVAAQAAEDGAQSLARTSIPARPTMAIRYGPPRRPTSGRKGCR